MLSPPKLIRTFQIIPQAQQQQLRSLRLRRIFENEPKKLRERMCKPPLRDKTSASRGMEQSASLSRRKIHG